jgi:hypothetical protein
MVQALIENLKVLNADVPLEVFLTMVQNTIHHRSLNRFFGQTPQVVFTAHKKFFIKW